MAANYGVKIMEVEKAGFGTTHRVAQCCETQCDWHDAYGGAGDSIERVARSAKKHAAKEGHNVVVESGTSFQFAG